MGTEQQRIGFEQAAAAARGAASATSPEQRAVATGAGSSFRISINVNVKKVKMISRATCSTTIKVNLNFVNTGPAQSAKKTGVFFCL